MTGFLIGTFLGLVLGIVLANIDNGPVKPA